ncbi:hypothetical protein BJ508DRAFT_302439 [Ascobolus immersus RN42]|uniref:Uncharacterized protein n=1 Tax=Ascobolus immersus RN42 TaxID=1160509 RepID=A0A3N4IPE8_ASCIM|nr:hypothetical protein BJ508DRAFT_302439 [Ascobolus immersus RN42]
MRKSTDDHGDETFAGNSSKLLKKTANLLKGQLDRQNIFVPMLIRIATNVPSTDDMLRNGYAPSASIFGNAYGILKNARSFDYPGYKQDEGERVRLKSWKASQVTAGRLASGTKFPVNWLYPRSLELPSLLHCRVEGILCSFGKRGIVDERSSARMCSTARLSREVYSYTNMRYQDITLDEYFFERRVWTLVDKVGDIPKCCTFAQPLYFSSLE